MSEPIPNHDESGQPAFIAQRRDVSFIIALVAEVERARQKFPSPDAMLAAIFEEGGEVAQAMMDQPWSEVRKECIQLAVTALRLAVEGDPTLRGVRVAKGLDYVGSSSQPQPEENRFDAPTYALGHKEGYEHGIAAASPLPADVLTVRVPCPLRFLTSVMGVFNKQYPTDTKMRQVGQWMHFSVEKEDAPHA